MRRISALFATTALCLVAADNAPDDDKPDDPKVTFRSDVSLGRVDAQVVDAANRPIRDLRVQDFIQCSPNLGITVVLLRVFDHAVQDRRSDLAEV
jgi:hypothetical protein